MDTIGYSVTSMNKKKDNGLYLRTVQKEDMDLLYKWANDPEVRAASFNTDKISYQDHKAWFQRTVNNSDEIIFILMNNEQPIGQIRFSIKGTDADISYSISKEVRGNGYGKLIIQLGIKKLVDEYPGIDRITAKVKPENVASYWCFEKNGFIERYRQMEFDLS